MPANEGGAFKEELSLIQDAAREAGEIAMRFFRRDPNVWWKDGNSPVSEADLEADKFLRRRLLDARPGYGWLSEETVDDRKRLEAPRTFVVDPIDGTRAFIGGEKTWCVSVAIVEDGKTIAGVLECPALGESFAATPGGGAWRNGRPIAVRSESDVLRLAGPKNMLKRLPPHIQERSTPHPYIPSLAYRLALVAGGKLDATFIKPYSHDWDVAAADLILAEAGGHIVDGARRRPRYAGPDPRLGALAAGSGPLLDIMADVVADLAV